MQSFAREKVEITLRFRGCIKLVLTKFYDLQLSGCIYKMTLLAEKFALRERESGVG